MRLHVAILRSAALLVPGAQRAEWLREWSAELWYVKQGGLTFCTGAFRDALWLMRNNSAPNTRRTFGLASPSRCILFLAVLAAVSVFLAFRLPLPRDTILPSPYRDARSLVMISARPQFRAPVPTVTVRRYQSLANRTWYRFTDVAFYRPVRTRVGSADLSVALASLNIFRLLEIPISSPAANSLILSRGAWRKYFASDPHVVGRVVEVAGQPAVVAGIIPASDWRLPGSVDAWLLQDDAHLAAMTPKAPGFVVARLRTPRPDRQWQMSVGNEQEGYDFYECTSLAKPDFLLASFLLFPLSFLLLCATTPLSLGDYPANRHSRRWMFLALKIVLLIPIVYCGSLDLASLVAINLQPHGLLLGSIAAMRWAVIDQRQRCPLCLRLLTNPTRIGGPSHTFLEWYGTELICARGHGLLYVPEIPTSCYSTQRWQYLDPSWSSLFS